MTNNQIINTIKYWKEMLAIKDTIYLVKDNETEFAALVSFDKKHDFVYLKYNEKYLKKLYYLDFCAVIFHEFGHIKNKTKEYNTDKEQIQAEYLAEKFACEKMKKYFKVYIRFEKQLKDKKWVKENPNHAAAFKKLYNELKK